MTCDKHCNTSHRMPLTSIHAPKVPLKSEAVLSTVSQCKQVVPIHSHIRQHIWKY